MGLIVHIQIILARSGQINFLYYTLGGDILIGLCHSEKGALRQRLKWQQMIFKVLLSPNKYAYCPAFPGDHLMQQVAGWPAVSLLSSWVLNSYMSCLLSSYDDADVLYELSTFYHSLCVFYLWHPSSSSWLHLNLRSSPPSLWPCLSHASSSSHSLHTC